MQKANFYIHLKELKNRFILAFIFFFTASLISYFYAQEIYEILLKPLTKIDREASNRKLIYTGLAEAFLSYMKLASFMGFIISFPYINFHIYRFIAPALYFKEKKFYFLILFLSPFLFYLGAFFAYYLIFPLAWQYFLSFENISAAVPIVLEARVSEYLDLSIKIIIASSIAFQLPIIMMILIKLGIFTVAELAKKRRYAILFFFIIAAIITPPDVFSQIAVAIPMCLLFELTLLFASKA